ncbi:TIR domain-containing protein [Psychrosphaera algicola]|uniref:TIR domain-containing protein n=1 Tax=Psychrosphaera algicola TaxID=3023714 RepID=A0ABT5FEN5_9GAMM|nr:TIR domain-containing protein [Psychrosphaera sp. G1-22]MDC2889494.1 TIR domain-containing protein [Psychrosphaera sp. G1-22]
MDKTYRLFISHSWAYSDGYTKVIYLIQKQGIKFFDHSVPKGDPIHTNGSDWQLKQAIENKMKGTSCIIIMAGVYSTYSKWINKEIEIAKAYGKSIIAIEPWASTRTSSVVKINADIIVKWQGASIARAIRKYG